MVYVPPSSPQGRTWNPGGEAELDVRSQSQTCTGVFPHMFLRAITVSGERQGLWVYEVSSGQLQRWTPELGIPVPESPFDALF